MTAVTSYRILAVAGAFAIGWTRAQAQIPVREIGPVIATSEATFAPLVVLRGLANGSAIVNEVGRRRLLYLDSTLALTTVVADSTRLPSSTSLMAYGNDTSLYPEVQTRTLLVLDEHGKLVRPIALPRSVDWTFVWRGAKYGLPYADPRGSLVYRAEFPAKASRSLFGPAVAVALAGLPDSAPLIRANFETRIVDTVAAIKVANEAKPVSLVVAANGLLVVKMVINPFPSYDQWIMLRDGTIAIVRAADYHVDWIAPDGQRLSTPAMPMDWHVLTDTEKQVRVNALNQQRAELNSGHPAGLMTPVGIRWLTREYDFMPLAEMPVRLTPVAFGSLHVDSADNIWMLPTTSLLASSAGLLYDVVNRRGQIVERVRLPVGCDLLGFGGSRFAFLACDYGNGVRIESVRVSR